MLCEKKILAVIPARGGSKGVPGKNIKMAGGKPLIAWMIEAARESVYIDRLVLSSDDDLIINIAKKYKCEVPFLRPLELAQDTSSASDVVIHALINIPGFDYVMLLQPTSPLTETRDIDGCIESCINGKANATVSVTEPAKSPYWMFSMDGENRLVPLLGKKYLNMRRQDLPDIYIPTGAMYIARTDFFLKNRSFYSGSTKGYFVPPERSLDIDSEGDFNQFEVDQQPLHPKF
jgi:CMP-N,N'-diacetyllegionaminic acid synthase